MNSIFKSAQKGDIIKYHKNYFLVCNTLTIESMITHEVVSLKNGNKISSRIQAFNCSIVRNIDYSKITNRGIIILTKNGVKGEVLREFIKRFKKLPK